MTPLDYVWAGVLAVFQGPELFSLLGLPIPVTVVMILCGFLLGIAVGANAVLNTDVMESSLVPCR